MKILYIANIRFPTEKAHGLQIMKTAENIYKSGVNLTLVTTSRGKKYNPFKFYDVEVTFPIKRIPVPDFNSRHPYIRTLIDWIAFAYRARKFIKKKDFDLLLIRIHPLLLKFFTRWKKSLVLDLDDKLYSSKYLFLNDLKKIKGVIVVSNGLKKDLTSLGIKDDKILTAPNGVELENFKVNKNQKKLREGLNLPQNKEIIMYTGSFLLYGWKGVKTLLKSSHYLNRNKVICLVGGRKKEIEKIKNKYKLNNIILIKRQPHKKIPLYLKAADMLVLPNKKGSKVSKKYTSPMKLFEYMASKKPIIASDIPAITEILNKSNSLLIKPNDPKKMAEAIQYISENSNFRKNISSKAFQDVKNYTWRNRGKKILNFIKQN
ncbi:MAG: glycosyltransferase [Candidatus Magasanikbacteria bacterium]